MPEIKGFRPEGPAEEKREQAGDNIPEVKGFAGELTSRDVVEAQMRRIALGKESKDYTVIERAADELFDKLGEIESEHARWIAGVVLLETRRENFEYLEGELESLLEGLRTQPRKHRELIPLVEGFISELHDFNSGKHKIASKEVTGFKQEAA